MVHVHGGSWAGATMAPEGKDNVKGQACLGCKRNSLRLEGQPETVSAGRVAGSHARRDGARDADADLPFEEGDASGLGVFSGTPGVPHGHLQYVAPAARFTT